MDLLVVAATEVRADLLVVLGKATTVVRDAPAVWLDRDATETDLVLVPGPRNGSVATARLTKQASALGVSIVATADRESVTATARAAEGLGVVTRRPA
jgi:hypothetical protein